MDVVEDMDWCQAVVNIAKNKKLGHSPTNAVFIKLEKV
jgi:hypothetical protein